MAMRKWNDLSPGTRKLIIGAAAAEGALKMAALIDLKRRPSSQIRGPKWIWVPVVGLVNAAGGAPLAYFFFGRRKQPQDQSN
ncbi:MAG: PLDc_N domain-containing protein [Streptosporangiaceae bacterium]|nr:PLDc_N domain-containing protein [Streptosporangiaceae bacterium]